MTPTQLAECLEPTEGGLPDLAELEAFERSIGTRLPDDYREFLLTMRGGRPKRFVVFSLVEGDEEGGELLGRVAGLTDEADLSIVENHRRADDAETPEGLLAIMTDAGGNDIAIATRPDRAGEIFFLDHEVTGGEGRPTLEAAEADDWGYAIRIAGSFGELVSRLRFETR